MIITVANLIAAGVQPTPARLMLEPLRKACAQFDIDTPVRVGAFIAQCSVESQGFTRLEENCYWSTPERIMRFFPSRVTSLHQASLLARNPQALANAVYAGKNGNGSPITGDGWRYRGRGCIQLTGRNNYSDAATELDRPYLLQPDLVAQPFDAALTAAWYWHAHKLNILADSAQSDAITRAINGPAMVERDLRRQLTEQGVQAFS